MTLPRITNAVLQERIDQQHTQVMFILARVEDKITMLCQRMQDAEIASVEDRARIVAAEERQSAMKTDLAGVKKHTIRLIVIVAVLVGTTSVAVDKLIGALLPLP